MWSLAMSSFYGHPVIFIVYVIRRNQFEYAMDFTENVEIMTEFTRIQKLRHRDMILFIQFVMAIGEVVISPVPLKPI